MAAFDNLDRSSKRLGAIIEFTECLYRLKNSKMKNYKVVDPRHRLQLMERDELFTPMNGVLYNPHKVVN